MTSSSLQDKVPVPVSLSSLLYLWGLSQLGVACMPGTVAPSITRSEQMGTALFPFHTLVLMGYSLKEVHAAEWWVQWVLIAAQPGFVIGALISSDWQMCFKCRWRITYPKFLHVGSISWVLGPTWSFYNDTVASLANHLGLHWIEWCGEFVFLSFTSTWSPTGISDLFCVFSLIWICFSLFFYPNRSVCGNQHVAQAILLSSSF